MKDDGRQGDKELKQQTIALDKVVSVVYIISIIR
jgi:hypothetical protein